MYKAAAFTALVAGAVAAPLWPGLAWAVTYAPSFSPPTTTGGTNAPSVVGHGGGAQDDLPPLSVTNTTPAPNASDTVSLPSSACTQNLTVAITPPADANPPTPFGSAPPAPGASGSFSVTGNAPATAGTYVIYASCQDAAGNPYVYTVTIVVPGTPPASQGGARAAAAGVRSNSTVDAPGTPAAAPAGSGALTGTWAPPADWSTPQMRAAVAQAVNAALADAPAAEPLGARPVVAHAAPGRTSPGAPWRDGEIAVVAGLAGASLFKLNRRHRPSRLSHRGGLFR